METMESKRRKRKEDLPRITFNTPNRVFERLFKGPCLSLGCLFDQTGTSDLSSQLENSLESLRATVNKKLGIDPGMRLEFSQIRNERSIDLEDGKYESEHTPRRLLKINRGRFRSLQSIRRVYWRGRSQGVHPGHECTGESNSAVTSVYKSTLFTINFRFKKYLPLSATALENPGL